MGTFLKNRPTRFAACKSPRLGAKAVLARHEVAYLKSNPSVGFRHEPLVQLLLHVVEEALALCVILPPP